MPIGKSTELREDKKGLFVKGYISPTSTGSDYRQLVKDGVIYEMSVGYVELESYTDENGVRHLTKLELLEISLVTFPANAAAKVRDYKGMKIEGGQKSMATPLNEVTLEDFSAAIADAVAAGLAATKSADPDDGETKSVDPPADPEEGGGEQEPEEDGETKSTKSASAGGETGQKGTKSISRAASQKSYSLDDALRKYLSVYSPHPQTAREEKKLPPGINWARCQKAMLLASGDPERAASIAYKMYGDQDMQRKIKAITVTNPTGGGFLVPEAYSAEVIPMLYAKAVVMKLGATVLPMPNGNLTMPKMTGGISASYVGEMRKAKEGTASFETIKLSAKKLMTKVPISNDILRSNTYAADQIVLKDAVEQMALRMDEAALMDAGTDFGPKGLLKMKGVARLAIGGKADEKTTGSMIAALIKKNADTSKLGWTFNAYAWEQLYNITNAMGLYIYREQMDNGKLTGHEYAVTTKLPVGEDAKKTVQIILGNWSDFIIGEQLQMQSEMFREGMITLDDGKIVSALDHDCTILRIISLHDFAVRHEESFVIADVQTA